MPSFDISSEVDHQEVTNAMDQAAREVGTRFDFRDTNSSAELGDGTITIRSMSEDRLRAVRQVVEEKLVRRKVSLKAIDWGTIEPASGGTVRQVATIVAGINSDKAREVNKFVKGLGLKGVQTQTKGEEVRVMA
ncbi:MAG: nucleotide-binding protein, partial [Microthrixaceae bacterium]|nr:nucleotide-binding protein [Microthrixaceae bacterium]